MQYEAILGVLIYNEFTLKTEPPFKISKIKKKTFDVFGMECLFDNKMKKKIFHGEVPFCRNDNYKLVFLQILSHKGKLKVEQKLVSLQKRLYTCSA